MNTMPMHYPTVPGALPGAMSPLTDLLDCVDFKWLMACEGHRVDLDRLQIDAGYACRWVKLAQQSPSSTLRQAAERLARALGASSGQA